MGIREQRMDTVERSMATNLESKTLAESPKLVKEILKYGESLRPFFQDFDVILSDELSARYLSLFVYKLFTTMGNTNLEMVALKLNSPRKFNDEADKEAFEILKRFKGSRALVVSEVIDTGKSKIEVQALLTEAGLDNVKFTAMDRGQNWLIRLINRLVRLDQSDILETAKSNAGRDMHGPQFNNRGRGTISNAPYSRIPKKNPHTDRGELVAVRRDLINLAKYIASKDN